MICSFIWLFPQDPSTLPRAFYVLLERIRLVQVHASLNSIHCKELNLVDIHPDSDNVLMCLVIGAHVGSACFLKRFSKLFNVSCMCWGNLLDEFRYEIVTLIANMKDAASGTKCIPWFSSDMPVPTFFIISVNVHILSRNSQFLKPIEILNYIRCNASM
jgi:hypothetical protein